LPQSADPTREYVRQARRLRARLSARPGELHSRIARLTTKPPAVSCVAAEVVDDLPRGYRTRPVTAVVTDTTPCSLPAARVLNATPEAANTLATEVERSIESGLLRFSARAAILKHAEQLGVSRFDANLIIASVLHAHATKPTHAKPAPNAARPPETTSRPQQTPRPWLGLAATFVFSLTGLALAFAWLLH
jgi:hypothetical protein